MMIYKLHSAGDALLEQHLKIIETIVANDPKAARSSAEAHIDYVMDSFREAEQLRDREHISELRLKQRTN